MHPTIEHLIARAVEDADDSARPRHLSFAGEYRVRRRQIERRHESGPESERRDVGKVAESGIARDAEDGARPDLLLEVRRSGVVRFEQRRAQRELVRLLAVRAPRRPLGIVRRRDVTQVRQHRHR